MRSQHIRDYMAGRIDAEEYRRRMLADSEEFVRRRKTTYGEWRQPTAQPKEGT